MNYEDEKYLVAPLTLTSYASFVVRLFMYICNKEGCSYISVTFLWASLIEDGLSIFTLQYNSVMAISITITLTFTIVYIPQKNTLAIIQLHITMLCLFSRNCSFFYKSFCLFGSCCHRKVVVLMLNMQFRWDFESRGIEERFSGRGGFGFIGSSGSTMMRIWWWLSCW